ncbi:MAG: hypothetical protein AAFR11_05910 [Pseudomonadota bacterium]
MRILHIANFSLRPKQAFFHNTERKLSNGFVRLGHSVLNVCDRDLVRLLGFGVRALGARRIVPHLVMLTEELKPDLIVLGHAHAVSNETVAAMREKAPDARVLYWNVDAMFSETVVRHLTSRLDVADGVFSTSGGPGLAALARPDRIVGFMPNPTDKSVESARAFENPAPEYDLFLATNSDVPGVRSHFGIDVDFTVIGEKLRAASPGFRFRHWVAARQGYLVAGRYQNVLYASRMGWNLNKRNDWTHFSSDRIAQFAGNGVLPLCPDEARLAEVLGEDGAEYYSSEDDFIERCARLAREDATLRAKSKRVWELYHERFNETAIAKYLIDATFGDFDPRSVDWPNIA